MSDSPEIKFSPENNVLYLDWSSANNFQSCHKRGWWKNAKQFVPVEEGLALTVGRCVHEALHTWDTTHGDDGAAIVKFAQVATAAGIPAKPEPGWNANKTKRTSSNIIDILQNYFHKWRADFNEETTVSAEVGFSVPLPGVENVMLCGRMDRRFNRAGRKRIRDYKTASQLGANIGDMARPNNQAQIYIWAWEVLTGERIDVFDFDMILIAKEKRDYQRIPIMYSRWDQEQMLEDMRIIASDILLKIKNNEWERATARCNDYGGCPYRELCNASNPQPLIEANFKVMSWHPYGE